VLDKAPVDADADFEKRYSKRKEQEAKEKSERIHVKYLTKTSQFLEGIEDEALRGKMQTYFDQVLE
jgi:hypothetical protein